MQETLCPKKLSPFQGFQPQGLTPLQRFSSRSCNQTRGSCRRCISVKEGGERSLFGSGKVEKNAVKMWSLAKLVYLKEVIDHFLVGG